MAVSEGSGTTWQRLYAEAGEGDGEEVGGEYDEAEWRCLEPGWVVGSAWGSQLVVECPLCGEIHLVRARLGWIAPQECLGTNAGFPVYELRVKPELGAAQAAAIAEAIEFEERACAEVAELLLRKRGERG